jgi:outer membrane lipopolysaccharide assembly protein LptE/RlpB
VSGVIEVSTVKNRRALALLFAVGLVPAAWWTTGCGYALLGRGSSLPEDVRKLYVQPFENRTQRAQVEQFVTNAIASELVTRQQFALVTDPDEADAQLDGAVTGFAVTPVSFDGQGRATEYEIAITARVALRRLRVENGVLWSNDNYVFREPYQLEVSQVGYFDQEDVAIEQASTHFAKTLVSDLLEGF